MPHDAVADDEEVAASVRNITMNTYETLMGVMPKARAVRANVEHYVPFYNPRMYNVWVKN